MNEITVHQLKEKLENEDSFFLLDVRDDFEYHISSIGGTLIPLDQLSERIAEVKSGKDQEVIVLCRSGNRSSEAQKLLIQHGFTNVCNVKGGINQWARQIDPSLPVY